MTKKQKDKLRAKARCSHWRYELDMNILSSAIS